MVSHGRTVAQESADLLPVGHLVGYLACGTGASQGAHETTSRTSILRLSGLECSLGTTHMPLDYHPNVAILREAECLLNGK